MKKQTLISICFVTIFEIIIIYLYQTDITFFCNFFLFFRKNYNKSRKNIEISIRFTIYKTLKDCNFPIFTMERCKSEKGEKKKSNKLNIF